MGMLSLGIVVLVVAVTSRYGIAGAVSATGAVAYAIVTPHVARLVDRHGQRRVLRPLTLVFGPRWRLAAARFTTRRCGRCFSPVA